MKRNEKTKAVVLTIVGPTFETKFPTAPWPQEFSSGTYLLGGNAVNAHKRNIILDCYSA